jgi:hypothetical protein
MTQLVLACTTIGRQANEVVQLYLADMLVQDGTLRFIQEGGVDPTQTSDARDDSILALDYYHEGTRVE